MKLVTLQPNGLSLPGLRPGSLLTFKPGEGPYGDWRVHVRGPSVYLVSPPGWAPGRTIANYEGRARRIYEIPRTSCFIGWDTAQGDKLDTRDWSPPCEGKRCPNALTLEDHLLCFACRDRAREIEDVAEDVVDHAQSDLAPTEPAKPADPEMMNALEVGGREVVVLAQGDTEPQYEDDMTPPPQPPRKKSR